MAPRVLFFDVGGVLLTNGWDRHARARAVDAFDLDADVFAARHEALVDAWETGRLTLDDYLDYAVFHAPRPYEPADFVAFMREQSRPHDDTLALLPALAGIPDLTLATINNESAELNAYRIDRFGLRDHFTAFFSSCYVGIRKPDAGIFRLAVRVLQRDPGMCLFVDDREVNVESARRCGLDAVTYRGAEALRTALRDRGLDV